MSNFLTKTKQGFGRITKWRPNLGRLFGSDPFRDWRILVVVATIFELILIYFAFYVWSAINQGQIFQVSQMEAETSETLDHESLQKVIAIFDSKEVNYQRLKSGSVRLGDPSR